MGSAPVRGSFESRLGSSARRGAYVGAGMAGVYRVTRERAASVSATPRSTGRPSVWITPPPQVVTGELASFKIDSTGDVHTEADFSDSCAEAWAEANVNDPGSSITSGMRLSAGGVFAGAGDGALSAKVGEGIVYVGIEELRSAGHNNFSYPSGSVQHPDDTPTVLSAQVVGAVVCDATDSTDSTASVRQVDAANWDFFTGPEFHGPTLLAGASVVVPAVAGVPSTAYPFAFDISWDANDAAAYVTVLDDWVNQPWDPHNQRSAVLTDEALTGETPMWTATVAIPRYRVPPAPATPWSSATHFYYADAGLWLGGDFTDLTGYPTALPADAGMLEFVILPPGDDPSDEFYTAPWADYNIYDAPPITHDHFEDGTTPDAGSHLWVLWWGPNGLVSGDPVPSVTDPMSLVPAVLAADGTG